MFRRFVWTWVMGWFGIKITFRLWELKFKKWNKINVKTKICLSVYLYMRNKNVQLAGAIKFCTIFYCIVWRHSTLNYVNIYYYRFYANSSIRIYSKPRCCPSSCPMSCSCSYSWQVWIYLLRRVIYYSYRVSALRSEVWL